MAAGMGLEATGIDSSPAAIASAEAKARDRGLTAHFLVHDALQLVSLDKQFDSVLDCGLFTSSKTTTAVRSSRTSAR